jgi:molybdopterin molybdotransferase
VGATTLTVEQALEAVARAAGAPRLSAERVPLGAAHGRVLAEDVAMDHAVPPFRRAAMDGFAVTDLGAVGARYRVAGRVAAGAEPPARIEPGDALRVMTGAPVPADARAVLPFEWTREDAGFAVVERRPGAEAHIVERGEHVAAGARVLARGARLGAAAVGVLATAGVAEVPVARRPRVAVLATGDELVPVASRPGPARIRNSNNPTLLAQAAAAGGEALDLGVAEDERGALAAALDRGLAADVLLVSGGVSRGDLDLVPGVLRELGVEAVFHGWRVQPGGPLWFGRRGDTLVFALPGNPAASFVGFELLAVPALATRLGIAFAPRRAFTAGWHGPAPGPHARRRYRPVRLASDADGGLWAEPIPWKGSGDPFALAGAEALAELPEAGHLADGASVVRVIPLGPLA